MPRLTFPLALALAALAQTPPEPREGNRIDFDFSGHRAFLIVPDTGAGAAWVWYAPVVGSYPNRRHDWLFNRLLRAGISIAGIDVGESYGNQAGRAVFRAFDAHMTRERGFGRPCLLAQSRGGLMLFNYAADDPARVRALAGIYPVLDVEGWLTLDDGRVQAAHGVADRDLLRALLPRANPIDRIAPLAAARLPLFLIHGAVDTRVPADRNSIPYSKQYAELGGEVKLVLVPGKGHEEVPEFFESAELLGFLTASCGSPRR